MSEPRLRCTRCEREEPAQTPQWRCVCGSPLRVDFHPELGPDADDRIGDPVTLWGENLPVEEIATYADTIPYQLVAAVTHREPSENTG